MLDVAYANCRRFQFRYAECHRAECCYAESRYAKCRYVCCGFEGFSISLYFRPIRLWNFVFQHQTTFRFYLMLCLNKLVCLTLLNNSTAALYLQVYCLLTLSNQGHMEYMFACLSK